MKGLWNLTLKNGKIKQYRYFAAVVDACLREYGFDFKAFDKYVTQIA